jgi:hypothetical protein
MDRLILDFGNDSLTIETNSQKGTEYYPNLGKHRKSIYDILGYGDIDISKKMNAIIDFLNRKMTLDDLNSILEEEANA